MSTPETIHSITGSPLGMDDTRPPSSAIEIWFDGDCPLCQGARDWCESRDRDNRLRFRDYRTARDEELPVSRDAADSSLWVHDAEDHVIGGYEAWRHILAELPRWRWLATVSGKPPFRWLGPSLYRVIARYRHMNRT